MERLKNYLILVSVLLLFFILYLGTATIYQGQKISLNEFLLKVKQGEIKNITLKNDTEIVAETKDGKIFKTSKDPGISLTEILKDYGISSTTIFNLEIKKETTGWKDIGIALLFNLLPFLLVAWIFWQIFRQAQRGTTQIFDFTKARVRIFGPGSELKEKITFSDIADLEEAKEELKEVIDFLKNPKKYLEIGAKIPRGILLVGPPGTGKTLLAKAVANEAGVPFFSASGSEFMEVFVGIGSARIRSLFDQARRAGRAIIFIDEIDSIGKMRGLGIGGGYEEREHTLNQLLAEMDGIGREEGILVFAATNKPELLDPALLRPGRFDRKIVLDLPDIKAREEILKIHLRDKKVGKINLKQIAQRTPGFSGADLANLCNEAAILAARRNKEYITQKELLDAIEKVLLGPERKTKVYSKKEKEIAAYHEAGHAIVAHYLPYASKVQKISIIARSRAGGYTLKLPTEEKNFYFKKEFLDELASILGGYAAEKLIFNDVTTGAQNDLEIATNLARQLVIRFGMSEKLGPISFARSQKFLPEFFEREYSEKTAETIDEEVRNLINQALERAIKVLEEKKDKLKKVAEVLIKKEVIEKKEFEKILASD